MMRTSTMLAVGILLLVPAAANATSHDDEGGGSAGEAEADGEGSEEPAGEPAGENKGEGAVHLTPASARPNRAIVVITDDGGIGEASARTARQLLGDELRTYKIDVVDAPVLEQVILLNDQVRRLATAMAARRVFALRLSKLGDKLLVRVEQLTEELESLDFRKGAAAGPEELDLVIPRIVKALIEGVPLEETARIDTVTEQEGRKWEKRPGEFNWGFGVLVGGGMWEEAEPAYGLNLKFSYEMEHVRLDTDLGGQFAGDGFFRLGVSAYYIPLTSFWSPYFGGGLNFMFAFLDRDDMGGYGVGGTLAAGLEFFRLHRVRLLAEIGFVLPFFMLEENYFEYGSGSDREEWVGITYGMVAVLW